MGTTKNQAKAAKANKAPKTDKTPDAVQTPAPAPVAAQPIGQVLTGMSDCALLRAMGYAGYTAKQGLQVLVALGKTPSPTTVACQVGGGRQAAQGKAKPHHGGAFVPLTPVQLISINAVCGEPAKPHATVAPLPPVAPRGATAAALAASNPQVAAALQAYQAALAAAAQAQAPAS